MESNGHSDKRSVPVWFWVIAVAGLLWFLMDAMALFMRVSMTEEALAKIPENQQVLYQNMPSWVNLVFALEVFGGLLGCIGLLLRKKWALHMLVISMVGVICQTFYVWFLSDARALMGSMAIVMPLVAICIGIVLLILSKHAIGKGWIR